MAQFVQTSDLNRMLDEKADLRIVQQINNNKASIEELDSTRKILDRLALEMEGKLSYNDMEK